MKLRYTDVLDLTENDPYIIVERDKHAKRFYVELIVRYSDGYADDIADGCFRCSEDGTITDKVFEDARGFAYALHIARTAMLREYRRGTLCEYMDDSEEN